MEHRFPTRDEELQLPRASATLWPGLGKIEVIILLRNCELLAQLDELRLFCETIPNRGQTDRLVEKNLY